MKLREFLDLNDNCRLRILVFNNAAGSKDIDISEYRLEKDNLTDPIYEAQVKDFLVVGEALMYVDIDE